MLSCEGYKMFHGTVHISPVVRADGTRWKEPFDLAGVWLYKPDTGYWYCKSDENGWVSSFSDSIMSDFREWDNV